MVSLCGLNRESGENPGQFPLLCLTFLLCRSRESVWQSESVTTTSYNFSNLSPITTYNVRVQADCGEGDLSKWTETTFTTTCGELELPYIYGFEDNLQTTSPYSSSYPFPRCWERIKYTYQYSTDYPYVFSHRGIWRHLYYDKVKGQ